MVMELFQVLLDFRDLVKANGELCIQLRVCRTAP